MCNFINVLDYTEKNQKDEDVYIVTLNSNHPMRDVLSRIFTSAIISSVLKNNSGVNSGI